MFAVLRNKPRTSHLLGRPCTTELQPQTFLMCCCFDGEGEKHDILYPMWLPLTSQSVEKPGCCWQR